MAHDPLVPLLARAERAVAEHDVASAAALLADLHWLGHDDASVHSRVHQLELGLAIRRRAVPDAAAEIAPVVFAGTLARLEALLPRYASEVVIAAPPPVVYDVITDFASYPAWNPWLVSARGEPRVGATVTAEVRLGRRTMEASHEVLVATPGESFAWTDRGWLTMLAGGRRLRFLEPIAGGTRLVQRLRLLGPMAHVAAALHGEVLARGLADETMALATRATELVALDARTKKPETNHA